MKDQLIKRILALVNARENHRIEVAVPLWTGSGWEYQHSAYTSERHERCFMGQVEKTGYSMMTEEELRDHLECIEEYECNPE